MSYEMHKATTLKELSDLLLKWESEGMDLNSYVWWGYDDGNIYTDNPQEPTKKTSIGIDPGFY